MGSAKTKYEPEFRTEAVRLVLEQGRSAAEVARSLRVHVNTLHGWVRHAAARKRGVAPRIHKNADDEAVRKLERELKRVTEERDILKKAVAFFANERK